MSGIKQEQLTADGVLEMMKQLQQQIYNIQQQNNNSFAEAKKAIDKVDNKIGTANTTTVSQIQEAYAKGQKLSILANMAYRMDLDEWSLKIAKMRQLRRAINVKIGKPLTIEFAKWRHARYPQDSYHEYLNGTFDAVTGDGGTLETFMNEMEQELKIKKLYQDLNPPPKVYNNLPRQSSRGRKPFRGNSTRGGYKGNQGK
jgi:hypothetical protein